MGDVTEYNGSIPTHIIRYLLNKHVLQLIYDFGELQHLIGQLFSIEPWKYLSINNIFSGKNNINNLSMLFFYLFISIGILS